MSSDSHYDIIIIGTGAGGGTLAHVLAASGKRILILERGDFIPRERDNWDARAVFEEKRYLAKDTWYDKDNRPFSPYTHYCVGGNTKMYGAALLRMRECDFDDVRHFGGTSPAWPITYSDLEPFYSQAEHMYHVHGVRGVDPCDPPASAPFPHPPLTPEPRIKALFDDLKQLGCRPFPIPIGVRLDTSDPRHAPYRLSSFDGYPDPTEVKADSHTVAISPILARPNITLIMNARVDRLITDASGREISGVVTIVAGERCIFSADIVVLSAGAINSAAILLRSANAAHPTGLANGSDQVGRNYMTHQNGCILAVTQDRNDSLFQKYFGLTDFYRSGSAGEPPFPLGTIQLMGKPDRGTIEWLRGDRLPGVPLEDIASRTIDFFITAEDLPHSDNRITLTADGSIKVSYTPNNTEAYDRLQATLEQLITQAELLNGRAAPVFLSSRLGVSGVSHQNGTLRFGTDPATSVLDIHCKAHQLDNLYIVDGSFFPSCSAVNPSLTIMANALRVGQHLLRRLAISAPSYQRSFA